MEMLKGSSNHPTILLMSCSWPGAWINGWMDGWMGAWIDGLMGA